ARGAGTIGFVTERSSGSGARGSPSWANAQAASPAPADRSAPLVAREGGSETSELIRAKAQAAPRAVRSAENHRQRGPVRLLVGEGESRQGPTGTDRLTSAFAESTRAPRPAAAAYPGPDGGRLLAVERMRPAVAGKQASGDEAAGVLLPLNACERMAHSQSMKGVVRSRPGRAFCSRQAQLGLASAMAAVRRVLPLGNSPGPASTCSGRLPLPAGTRLVGRPPSGGPAEIVEAVNSRPDGGDLTGRRSAGDMVGRLPRVLADQRSRDAEIDVATLPTYSAPSAAFWPIVTDAPAGRSHAYRVDSCPPL